MTEPGDPRSSESEPGAPGSGAPSPGTTGLRLIGVDYGDQRTGLAATDTDGRIIVPLRPLVGLDDRALSAALAELAADRESHHIVVGLPLGSAGQENARVRKTRAFLRQLGRATRCSVVTIDESFTTDEAHARMKEQGMKASARRKIADSVAATLILERYLASLTPPSKPDARGSNE